MGATTMKRLLPLLLLAGCSPLDSPGLAGGSPSIAWLGGVAAVLVIVAFLAGAFFVSKD